MDHMELRSLDSVKGNVISTLYTLWHTEVPEIITYLLYILHSVGHSGLDTIS